MFKLSFIIGFTITKVLDVLDTLDRHNFDKVENNNSLDSLYNKIFAASQAKDGTEVSIHSNYGKE